MLTLLGSILGFMTSVFPDLLNIHKEKMDRKHELAILDKQMEQMKMGHSQRLEEIQVSADIQESKAIYKHDAKLFGVKWADGLRASVRPIITYGFFILFCVVKISILVKLVQDHNMQLHIALPMIWDSETQALFAAIMSFWFGSRALGKFRSKQ